jgi:hypothetical protein
MSRIAALLLAAAAVASGWSPGTGRAADAPGRAASVRLGRTGAVNSGAGVAADGSRVVVTWAAKSETSTDVYAAFSRDGGASFGAPTRVNDVEGDARMSGEQAPRVALGTGVEVVWVSRRAAAAVIRAAKTRAGEETFGPATTVHAESLSGTRGWASLAVDPDAAVHVAWLDGRDGQAAGGAAEAGKHSGHGSPRQDIFHAVWRRDGTHDEVRMATDVCFCCKTAIATGPGGNVYAAWRHIYPPNLRDIAVARSTDGGRTFAAPARLSEDGWAIDGCPDDGPSMAVDLRGVVHIAWPTMVPGSEAQKGVFYSYSADGGRTFAPRVRLDEGGSGAAHPQLAVGGGRVVVVWEQGAGQRRVYARDISSDPKAAAWTPRVGQAEILSTEGRAVYPVVASTPTSTVVAWTEDTGAGSDIRVRRLAR